ncbi:hypothetical protein QBC39DRAFT_348354 [Podospora conica]|nr:hypothetical protein QBC39DRAFT_348354 [Schizothecium conicum]
MRGSRWTDDALGALPRIQPRQFPAHPPTRTLSSHPVIRTPTSRRGPPPRPEAIDGSQRLPSLENAPLKQVGREPHGTHGDIGGHGMASPKRDPSPSRAAKESTVGSAMGPGSENSGLSSQAPSGRRDATLQPASGRARIHPHIDIQPDQETTCCPCGIKSQRAARAGSKGDVGSGSGPWLAGSGMAFAPPDTCSYNGPSCACCATTPETGRRGGFQRSAGRSASASLECEVGVFVNISVPRRMNCTQLFSMLVPVRIPVHR